MKVAKIYLIMIMGTFTAVKSFTNMYKIIFLFSYAIKLFISPPTDKHQLIARNLGRFFKSRSGCMCAVHLAMLRSITAKL
jgi:hypothetical protein